MAGDVLAGNAGEFAQAETKKESKKKEGRRRDGNLCILDLNPQSMSLVLQENALLAI
jgi:hypothetical protein